MSHELRTPLNAIIGYSEILAEDAEDSGRKDELADLEKIRSAGKHLLALINDVLDLSKIEAGKAEVHLETFEVSPMLQEVVATITPLVAKNGNRLEVRCAEGLGALQADLTKVRQALFNLLLRDPVTARLHSPIATGGFQDLDAAVLPLWTSFDSRHGLLVFLSVSSGRARSVIARARSVNDPLFVRDHAPHGLRVRRRHFRLTAQLSLPAGGLLREDVRMERVIPLKLAASGLLEPLGGSAVRLHLRHSLSLNLIFSHVIPSRGDGEESGWGHDSPAQIPRRFRGSE